jgi:hypothetical protein
MDGMLGSREDGLAKALLLMPPAESGRKEVGEMETMERCAISARRLATVDELGVGPDQGIDRIVEALATLAEAPVVRRVQFPAGALLLVMVAGEPESGWMYLLDRRAGVLYSLDFGDNKSGGYSLAALDEMVLTRRLLRIARNPALLANRKPWYGTRAA